MRGRGAEVKHFVGEMRLDAGCVRIVNQMLLLRETICVDAWQGLGSSNREAPPITDDNLLFCDLFRAEKGAFKCEQCARSARYAGDYGRKRRAMRLKVFQGRRNALWWSVKRRFTFSGVYEGEECKGMYRKRRAQCAA